MHPQHLAQHRALDAQVVSGRGLLPVRAADLFRRPLRPGMGRHQQAEPQDLEAGPRAAHGRSAGLLRATTTRTSISDRSMLPTYVRLLFEDGVDIVGAPQDVPRPRSVPSALCRGSPAPARVAVPGMPLRRGIGARGRDEDAGCRFPCPGRVPFGLGAFAHLEPLPGRKKGSRPGHDPRVGHTSVVSTDQPGPAPAGGGLSLRCSRGRSRSSGPVNVARTLWHLGRCCSRSGGRRARTPRLGMPVPFAYSGAAPEA